MQYFIDIAFLSALQWIRRNGHVNGYLPVIFFELFKKVDLALEEDR